jgi:hypothetical protein
VWSASHAALASGIFASSSAYATHRTTPTIVIPTGVLAPSANTQWRDHGLLDKLLMP